MKHQKKIDNIHHFAHEFSLEDIDIKDKSGVTNAHHEEPHPTKDGQFAQIKKQIMDLNKRMDRLEKMFEDQL